MTIFILLILYYLAVIIPLLFFVCSNRRISKVYFFLLGIAPSVLIYLCNTNYRIYSYHGFMHASIVYQIASGNIPPSNPLLAGVPLSYPWGYHYFIALLMRVCNIAPSWLFAITNIISFSLAIVLIYKISQLIIKDEKANIFSVLISLFGISTSYLFGRLFKCSSIFKNQYFREFELRGVPVYKKFINTGANGAGVAFFLLFLYAIVKLFKKEASTFSYLLLFIGILGCGFFYPGMLLMLIASMVLISLINLAINRDNTLKQNLLKTLSIFLILLITLAILKPYLLPLFREEKTVLEIFNPQMMLQNIFNYVLICGPLLYLIYLNRKYLEESCDKQALLLVSASVIATGILYISLHVPLNNEYKILMLSAVTLGILGGIVFNIMRQKNNQALIFILLLFSLLVPFISIPGMFKSTHFRDKSIEAGKIITWINKDEEQLYRWIRERTPKNSVFIDSQLTIPVFGQRQLFIGFLKKQNRSIPRERNGYTVPHVNLNQMISVLSNPKYDLQKRKQIVKDIYNLKKASLDNKTMLFLSQNKNIYIVVRNKLLCNKFKEIYFEEVFKTLNDNFFVYKKKAA